MRINQGADEPGLQAKRLTTLEQLLAIQATELKPALTAASTLIAAAVGADKVDTFLYDSTTATLVAVGTSRTPLGQKQIALGLDRLALANGGRSVEVFENGRTYHNGRVDTDLEELRGIREALEIRSELCVPLEIEGVRRGVLQADSLQSDAFTLEDLHFLEAVAHWVGIVIQRAELIEQRTREAEAEGRRLAAEELVTILAHDLGNYLTPLLGRAELLRARAERAGEARNVRDAASLQHGLQRLQRLIKDLLDVGRIEQGVFAVVRQPVDLVELASTTVAALHTPDMAMTVEGPDELVATVDPDRIRQALENLVTNAQRHAPSSPVVVTVERQPRSHGEIAILSIRDRGPGIAADVLPELMDRFVRGRRSQGLGLGLYLARNIAEAHGGSLEVTSTVGEGATFRMLLPLTAE